MAVLRSGHQATKGSTCGKTLEPGAARVHAVEAAGPIWEQRRQGESEELKQTLGKKSQFPIGAWFRCVIVHTVPGYKRRFQADSHGQVFAPEPVRA
jgi:hypothetical protein